MRRWWLLLGIIIALVGLALWLMREAPSSAAYREAALQVLRGGGIDPGLAFLLRGLREDLDCRDESLCLRKENFAFVFDLAEQYEHFFADYRGRVCQSRRLQPNPADRADHEQLCRLLEELSKEVGGIKHNASLALNFLTRNDPIEVQSLLRNFLQRILEHRERVLAITEELRQMKWLEPVLSTGQP